MKAISIKKLISIVLVNLLLFAGCSSYFNSSNIDSENLMMSVKQTSWPTAPSGIDSRYKDALLDFSWNILQ